jgi:RNA polymerase sigma-70 factor, ECF subfamily
VTQDVLLQVIRKLDTFRGDAQLTTWLHRVTVNAALAYRQKRANRQKRETGDATDELLETAAPETAVKRWNVSPEDPVLAAEEAEIIEKAIGQLPEPFRDVYVLADVEGLSNAEIGEMLDLSVPAVKSRLHRARMRMRDLLAPHYEGELQP